MNKLLPLLVGASLAVTNVAVLAEIEAARALPFSIESQPVCDALNEWARQTGIQISCLSGNVIVTPALKGKFTAPAALEQLLAGTSLTHVWVNDNLVAIGDSKAVRPRPPGAGVRTAQAAATDAKTRPHSLPADPRSRPHARDELEEIMVTGTHISGVLQSASAFTIYERSQIDATAAGNLQTLLEGLPQNFGGGASEHTVLSATGAGNSNNVVGGSGVNLRGLGNDATLVLFDGHRIAPANFSGNFVDLSLIPLSAVERVEIVWDSASAIYGSDAVGGVVNVIPRRTFDGAETRARHAFVAHGDSAETQIAQTLGYRSDAGSVLANYEYTYRSPLSAGPRAYVEDVQKPITLLPQQALGSFFLAADRKLSTTATLFADALYSYRTSDLDIASCLCTLRRPTQIDAYTATVGARIELPRDSRLELTWSDSVSDTHQRTLRDAVLTADNRVSSGIRSMEAKLDGSLGSLPGGPVYHAIGVQFREESLDTFDARSTPAVDARRRVLAEYVELRIPLIGPAAAAQERSRLQLSLSGRHEHYSDFGSTFNPQIGAVWRPVEKVRVRATYGTAFKAPLLNDLDPRPRFPVAVAVDDPLTGGSTPTLFVFGGNRALEPERATTWTASFDWWPTADWHMAATYYDIRIEDRIVDPSTYVDPFDALALESVLGPAVVERAPARERVQAIVASPEFASFVDDLSGLSVLVDSSMQNLAAAGTRGFDLSASFNKELGLTTVEADIKATYIVAFDSRFAAAANLRLLNRPYNPIDIKAQAHLGLTRGGLSLSAFLNYIDSYHDARSGIDTAVSSWATGDVTLGYQTRSGDGLLSDIAATLGIRNVTDRDPPYVRNLAVPIHYDGANANALGRFYSVQFSKRW